MQDLWLIADDAVNYIELASSAPAPTPEQLAYVEKLMAVSDDGYPSNMVVSGDQAVIKVAGVLTGEPNWFYLLTGIGNTTYRDIRAAIALVEGDSRIKRAKMYVNSPGGEATADWVETVKAVASASKPIDVIVENLAASAAYGIATQGASITARNEASEVGSIGVVQRIAKPSELSRMEITSSNAPNKRPNPETPEGEAVIRKTLDSLESIFIDYVAKGRGVGTDVVKTDFGRGGVLLAEEALKVGMIDAIASNGIANNSVAADVGATRNTAKEGHMDLATLKAEHPAIYAAAVAEGVAEGVKTEKARAEAHIILGEACGDMSIAIQAIKDGEEMTPVYSARYQAASMTRKEAKAAEEADADAANALDGVNTGTDASKDMEDQVANAMTAMAGIGGE